MAKSEILVQAGLVLIVAALLLGGLIADDIHHVPVTKANAYGKLDYRIMYVSGMVISSHSITLDFNPCDMPIGDEYASSRLYDPSGVSFNELLPGATRDVSIAQFAYLNLSKEASVVMGDIGILIQRGSLSRLFLWSAFIFQCLNLVLLLKVYFFGGTRYFWFPALLTTSVVLVWGSLINMTSIIPILLSHLFQESIMRCELAAPTYSGKHWELINMAKYVFEYSKVPNGITIILVTIAVSLVLIYVGVYLSSFAMKNVRLSYLVRFRSLHWYTRIWPVYVTMCVFGLSIICIYLVAIDDSERGFPLNLFHWDYASAGQMGLSRTGTLIDIIQGSYALVAIPPSLVRGSVYVWLAGIPIIAAGSTYPLTTFFKSIQDISTLLLVRSLIAWVTVSPSSISVIENPACFEPSIDFRSCNDSMFSIPAVVVVVPAIIGLFFLKFSGVLHSKFHTLAHISMTIAVKCVMLLVIVARYQYSADASVGVFVSVLYMYTQQSAYELLFNKESNSSAPPNIILQEGVLPALGECVRRIGEYNIATHADEYSKVSNEELDEVKFLYRNVGDAISRARSTRSVASSPVAIGTPIEQKKDQ